MENFIATGYKDQYGSIVESITIIPEEYRMISPIENSNSPYWILGHILVARLNLLAMLGEPSIYPAEVFQQFIPGSTPGTNNSNTISFFQMASDFKLIHPRFLDILTNNETDLDTIIEGKSVIGHLLEYLAHEAFHAGQLDILAAAAK